MKERHEKLIKNTKERLYCIYSLLNKEGCKNKEVYCNQLMEYKKQLNDIEEQLRAVI